MLQFRGFVGVAASDPNFLLGEFPHCIAGFASASIPATPLRRPSSRSIACHHNCVTTAAPRAFELQWPIDECRNDSLVLALRAPDVQPRRVSGDHAGEAAAGGDHDAF
jgi:hypothetical protein